MNGVSARVFKYYFYFMTSLKARVFDLKGILRAFQTVNFIDNWRMDKLFLSLAVRKKSSNFRQTSM